MSAKRTQKLNLIIIDAKQHHFVSNIGKITVSILFFNQHDQRNLLTENRFSSNEMQCVRIIHNNVCHIYPKGFLE